MCVFFFFLDEKRHCSFLHCIGRRQTDTHTHLVSLSLSRCCVWQKKTFSFLRFSSLSTRRIHDSSLIFDEASLPPSTHSTSQVKGTVYSKSRNMLTIPLCPASDILIDENKNRANSSCFSHCRRMLQQGNGIDTRCSVCGAPAVYINFGIISCSSCKMFFKRNAESGQVSHRSTSMIGVSLTPRVAIYEV